jgi:energy-coupling factor transporter ATP-binding protein EcfA2
METINMFDANTNSSAILPGQGTETIPAPGVSMFERIQRFKNIYVRHQQVEKVERDLKNLFKYGTVGTSTGPANCYLLTGETGWGKSTLLRNFANQHPLQFPPGRNVCQVLYIELKGTASLKDVALTLLNGLKATYPRSANEKELTRLAAFHLRAQEVKIVIIDEAQNFVDQANKKFSYPAAEWLKGLLNEGACAFVFAGMPAARLIYDCTEQLERRSLGSAELTSFDWKKDENLAQFQEVVAYLLNNLPSRHELSADDPRLVYGLIAISRGRVGMLVDFLAKTCIYAAEDGTECVKLCNLADAAERLRPRRDPLWQNLFELDEIELEKELQRLRGDAGQKGRALKIRRGNRQPKLEDIHLN